jgi:hypothetical protein
MKAGLAKLEGRAPLGSTNMGEALRGALASFVGDPVLVGALDSGEVGSVA